MTRSQVMSRVRGSNTRPELRVRQYLWARGLRYRLHSKSLPGKPDLVFASRRIAVFVHGCFWHRHRNCPNTRTPKSRLDFWVPKLTSNAERDRANVIALEQAGWTVLTVWECETKDFGRLQSVVESILAIEPKQ